jgi:pimeloyl-ACP methyl ester carboxylesterase
MITRQLSSLASAGLILVLFLMSLLFNGFRSDVCLAQAESAEAYTGKLSDAKSDYNILVPPNWNGTVFVSLDTLAAPSRRESEKVVRDWLLNHGYAVAGTDRNTVGWNFKYAAANVVEVLDTFIKLVGKTKRSIVWGKSLGGAVTRAVIQLHPDRFDAAVPMCGGGAGCVAMYNYKLDSAFALDELLGKEYGIRLQLHGIKDAPAEENRRQQLLNKAQQTPDGRARVALAGAFSQVPVWNWPDQSEPAEDDYDSQQANVASGMSAALGTPYIPLMENLGGGPFTWNKGVDYQVQLNKSGYKKLVQALYEKAGLDLKADLDKLEKASRLSANPDAVAFIEKNNITWTGDLQLPVLSMTTTGDSGGPISDENSYADVVHYAGKSDLLRQAFVHRCGHCNFTAAEQIAVFEALIKRLDTGKWEEGTTADGLTKLVTKLQSESSLDLGGSNFVPIDPPEALRTWDVRNWGTYKPAASYRSGINGEKKTADHDLKNNSEAEGH